jgi:hypothetical protein
MPGHAANVLQTVLIVSIHMRHGVIPSASRSMGPGNILGSRLALFLTRGTKGNPAFLAREWHHRNAVNLHKIPQA